VPYDLFFSYARRDNAQERITQLKARIEADHRQFVGAGGPDLKVFFDTDEILGMDDWRHRILGAISDTRLLLVCLSPAYLGSEYCAWEFNEYLKHEAARALLGEGVAPVYFVAVPGWFDKDYDQRAAEWVAELRRRQHVDLRPWFDEGAAALRDSAVGARMDELNRQIHDRLGRIQKVLEAKGNVDRHNEHFKGRTAELRRLREAMGLGKVGVLTAVHGLGGMGKTALAVEYAYAFAHEYPGGRWQVRCEGRDDLRVAVASLAGARELEFEFTEEEKKDLDLQFERVLRELKKRADAAPGGRVLLILDNVDRPNLLEPAQTARLPQAEWLHVVATTRLGEDELFGAQKDRAFLPVDELPEAAALELIESYQPGGKCRDGSERAAAEEIVRLLGRFTLAVETAAVFLGQFRGDVTCAGFRDRLKREGLTGLEVAAGATAEGVRHGEKSLTATLAPTLERLGERERLALAYAALLPADHVPLPWLRALTAARFPELGRDAEPGYPDPWQSLARRLFSLRLLQPTGVRDARGNPLVARMHRLVQGCIGGEHESASAILDRRLSADMGLVGQARRVNAAAAETDLLTHSKTRAKFLWRGWVSHEHRWELGPLAACAWQWLERESTDGAYLANWAAGPLQHLGKFAEAEPLLRRALAIDEHSYGPDHPNVATALNNLAELLEATNRLAEAEPLLRRALAIWENSLGANHPNVASARNNLAGPLYAANRLAEAEPLLRRALAIDERCSGPQHPHVARDLNNLAELLRASNRLAEAEPLYRRALAINERSYGPDHPEVAIYLNNLALLLSATNRLAEAEPRYRRALAIDEQTYGPDHPDVARDLNNLALLLDATNRLTEAEPLYRRVVALFEASLGPDHPNVATAFNNLAWLLYATNRFAEAEPLYRRALAIWENSLGANHPNVASALNGLAALLKATNRFAEAEPLYRRALAIWENSLGANHPNVASALNGLAALLKATNRLAEAEPLFRRALAIEEQSDGPDHPTVATGLNNLAVLLGSTNRLAEAEPLCRRAVQILIEFRRTTGDEHPHFRRYRDNYRGLLQAMGKTPDHIEQRLQELTLPVRPEGS